MAPATSINEKIVSSILGRLHTGRDALLAGDESARLSAIADARKLIASLQTPMEGILRIAWAEPALLAATRICIDVRLFERLSDASPDALHVDQLAGHCGIETSLLSRFLRHLSSMQVIEEVAANQYRSTALSNALTVPRYRDAIPYCSEVSGPIFQKLPAFLEKTKYADPKDSTAGPFQFGHETLLSPVDWRRVRPQHQASFNNHMAGYHTGRPSWMDPGFYPVENRLVRGFDTDQGDVFLLDVGGNKGHDLQELRRKQSSLPGRLILQDLPHVLEGMTESGKQGIEPVSHDFFTPQPIKGARAYFMHSVLHDWADYDCQCILQHLADAMRRDYSKLLICENIVPDQRASWQMTSLDIFMMIFAAARERTESDWRAMLEKAGLKVTGIWTADPRFESLIEAELV